MKKILLQQEQKPGTALEQRISALRLRIHSVSKLAEKTGKGKESVSAVQSLALNGKTVSGAEKMLDGAERLILSHALNSLFNTTSNAAIRGEILSLDRSLQKGAGTAKLERIRLALPAIEEKIAARGFEGKKPLHGADYSSPK